MSFLTGRLYPALMDGFRRECTTFLQWTLRMKPSCSRRWKRTTRIRRFWGFLINVCSKVFLPLHLSGHRQCSARNRQQNANVDATVPYCNAAFASCVVAYAVLRLQCIAICTRFYLGHLHYWPRSPLSATCKEDSQIDHHRNEVHRFVIEKTITARFSTKGVRSCDIAPSFQAEKASVSIISSSSYILLCCNEC
ncbi:hypothetical protein DIPPA_60608 [Diplonema papillatum]|nr:hypothetical protein DIPPA_60608 [Diplonema papillatum]